MINFPCPACGHPQQDRAPPDDGTMPRPPRYTPPGTVQHFISRIAGAEFRISGQAERAEFRRRLGESISLSDWTALALALMSNHEHLAALAGSEPSEWFLKPLHTGYARWLNDRQGRFGHVYAGRPQNVTFETDQAIAILIAYIHNNPVRAGLVKDPVDSNWTTHRAYLGEDRAPAWLDVECGLCLCGFDATGNGRANFHDFVRSRVGDGRDPTMSGQHAKELRAPVRAELGFPVELSPAVDPEPRATLLVPGNSFTRPNKTIEPEEFIVAIAPFTGVSAAALCSGSRDPAVVHARRAALLVWARAWSLPAAKLVQCLGVTPQACSKLLRTARTEPELAELASAVAERIASARVPHASADR